MFISRIAQQVLTTDYHDFNKNIYLQKSRTVVDTRMALSYANLFIKYLEADMLNITPLKSKIWLSYVDDIFMIWQHGNDKLEIFLTMINTIHPTTKFTANKDPNEYHFWIP